MSNILEENLVKIVFAEPVHNYDSYTDFWRLVGLSNFPIIRVDEIDLTQDYIVITTPMNGDYKEYIGGQIEKQKSSGLARLAHLIIWNLERPAGSGSTEQYAKDCFEWFSFRLADEIWVSDPALADETMLRYVPLGSDYGLGEVGEEKQYDYTHMSVTIPRRVHVYKNLNNAGPNCWPPERDEVLKKSRFALNVHQDNYPFCEPLRIALFAAYGLPIISENFVSGYSYIFGGDIRQLPYHGLVNGLKSALEDDYVEWQEMGLRLRKTLCKDYQFGKMVRKAIEESVGIGWR